MMGVKKMIKPYFEDLKRNLHGGINGVYFNGQFPKGIPYTLDPEMGHIEKAEAGEWGTISPLDQDEKDVYKEEQAKADIMQKLSALDLPAHTLALAISGDELALKKVAGNEELKATLREELATIK